MSKKAKILGAVVMTAIMVLLAFSGINAPLSRQGVNAQNLNETNDAKYNVNNTDNSLLRSIEVPVSTSVYKTQAGMAVVELKYNYMNDRTISNAELGKSTVIKLNSGTVSVEVNGRVVTLSIILNDKNIVNRINPSSSGFDGTNINVRAMDSSLSGSYVSSSIHYKYRSGHEAVLDVTRVDVLPLSFDTIAQVLAIFGEVVATETGTVVTINPELAELTLAVVTAVAADFGVLYAYALDNGYKSVYLDIGGSWGIYWYNFWQLGVYGEEGAYSNNFN